MQTLKLSGKMIEINLIKHQAVTVRKTQRNGFEMKIQFINLHGVIVKQFICANNGVEDTIQVTARQYNYTIID